MYRRTLGGLHLINVCMYFIYYLHDWPSGPATSLMDCRPSDYAFFFFTFLYCHQRLVKSVVMDSFLLATDETLSTNRVLSDRLQGKCWSQQSWKDCLKKGATFTNKKT